MGRRVGGLGGLATSGFLGPKHPWGHYTFGFSESDSSDIFPTPACFNFSPCQRGTARGPKSYRQAPTETGVTCFWTGKLHGCVWSYGLCRSSNTGCGPRGEKCRFGRWGTSSCKTSSASQGLRSNVSTFGSRACSSFFSTGSSWIWPAWVHYHNYTAIYFNDTPQ